VLFALRRMEAARIHDDEVDVALPQELEVSRIGGAAVEQGLVARLDGVAEVARQSREERGEMRQQLGPNRGGSWRNSVPSLDPSGEMRARNSSTSRWASISSLSWVIVRGNLKQNRKWSGT